MPDTKDDGRVDKEDVRAVYGALLSRWEASNSMTWQVIGMSVAAEGGLWVALAQISNSLFQLFIGLGLLAVGAIAALSIRFTELSATLDKQMLDICERDFDIPPAIRLRHDLRFEQRLRAVSAHLDAEQRERLFLRRIAKSRTGDAVAVPPRREVSAPSSQELPPETLPLWRLDGLLSALGQPSMAFTALLAFSGAVGFGTGVYQWSGGAAWGVLAFLVGAGCLVLPWVLSANGHGGRALRHLLYRLVSGKSLG